MKLYRVECLKCEFTVYLMSEYSRMHDAQLDILAHYLTVDKNPFMERKTREVLETLYDNNIITQESLDTYIPFSKIKEAQTRGKSKIKGEYKSVDT